MARRRGALEAAGGGMPPELCTPPVTDEQVAAWSEGEQPGESWAFGEAMWRRIQADARWSAARRRWRTAHDRSYWWYWRSRGLTPPSRAQLGAYAREVTADGTAS
ncbi:hypothetical protein AB0N38_11645 [Micromonospora aurantiaca]|uniref:hypothetical protein n=1 Tax=Micromonospora aurantiaca (nom. illeg.) TaxID=47850 RepID=UPI0034407DBE